MKTKIKKSLVLLIHFILFLVVSSFSAFSATKANSKIDVLDAVNNGEAVLSATEWDIGHVNNCFDGDTTTLMRSKNINPAFVQINFNIAQTVSKVRVLLGEPGYSTIDRNDWLVEIADTQEDLDSKSGSYQLIVPRRYDVGGNWDEATFPSRTSAKIWKFNIERVIGHDDYVHIPELELWANQFTSRFLIIVSNPLYQTGLITEGLNNYQTDLQNEGWSNTIITVNKNIDSHADYYCPDESDLKNVIHNFYSQGGEGFVIIGSPDDIPTAYWRHHTKREVDNPTDLYYADMDEWIDIDGNGVYESWDSKWENGTWEPDKTKPANPDNLHLNPELLFGRITAGPMASTIEEEAEKVAFYLAKIHEYRAHGSNLTSEQFNRALFFRADEYCPNVWDVVYGEFMPNMYCNHGIMVSGPNDLAEELQKGYLSASIVTHSGNDNHALFEWENAKREFGGFSLNEVAQVNPKVHFVILFACSAAKFTSSNFGAAYIFNTDYALNLIGSTGLWGVLLDQTCGQQLNNGIPVGTVIKNYIIRTHDSEDAWPKGILHGDPLIKYEINNPNKPPRITNKEELNYLETSVGENYQLTFRVTDPENDPVYLEIADLPENAHLSGNTLYWTPSWAQVDSTFKFRVKAIDSYNNSYTAGFTIYVNHFKNGLLSDHSGWQKSGNGSIYLTDFSQPFKCKATCMQNNSSWTSLEQNINVEPFKWYNLEIWADINLPNYHENTYIKIAEINQQLPFEEIVDQAIRYDDNYYCSNLFFSGNNNNLTFSLHAGDENNLTDGQVIFTGLRLVDLSSQLNAMLVNGDFESGTGNTPDSWSTESFSNAAVFEWENGTGRNSSHCASIHVAPDQSDDARWIQNVQLLPNTTYKLSGWIKGENIVQHTGYNGANLSIINVYTHTAPLTGTFDWTYREIEFDSPADGIVTIGCRLGYFGSIVSGKAWFDDVTLTSQQSITVTVPNGGETWQVGAEQTLTWQSYGIYGDVKIEFSPDGGANWELLANSTPDDGERLWTPKERHSSDNCLIKITSVEIPIISDVSDAPFSVSGASNIVDVWPGDTNNDGTVTVADVLPVGLYFQATGPAREQASMEWRAQPVYAWEPVAATYADATGSGEVNVSDILPIALNYGKQVNGAPSPLIPPVYAEKENTNLPVIVPRIDVLSADTIGVTIHVQTVTDLLGIAFDLNYSSVDGFTLEKVQTSGQMGDDLLSLHKVFSENGLICAGVSRKAQDGGITGDAEVYQFKFHKGAQFSAEQVDFTLNNVEAITSTGEQIEFEIEGGTYITSVAYNEQALPENYQLHQNYPNPFNPSTNITFSLPTADDVTMKIYNLRGQCVETLVDDQFDAGIHRLQWQPQNEPSGVYVCKIRAGKFSSMIKMLFVK